jgi:hypothetical protein
MRPENLSSIRRGHRSLAATTQQVEIDPGSVVDDPKIERVSLIGHPLMCSREVLGSKDDDNRRARFRPIRAPSSRVWIGSTKLRALEMHARGLNNVVKKATIVADHATFPLRYTF